jgi:DnaJ-class molecular chaperone
MNTMDIGLIPQPPCTAGCTEGRIRTTKGGIPVESTCTHCNGTGREPPLTERELELHGQRSML